MHETGHLMVIDDSLDKVDFTSMQNLNDALFSSLLAAGPALGKVYNISNGAPVPLWDVVNFVLRRFGLPPVSKNTCPSAWPMPRRPSTRRCASCCRGARSQPISASAWR